jgi:hypothetical protein
MDKAKSAEDVRKSVLTEIASILMERPNDCQARLDAVEDRLKRESGPVVPPATRRLW